MPNSNPSTANKTIKFNEDSIYTFKNDDFQFIDSDSGDLLLGIEIQAAPLAGTLKLDGIALDFTTGVVNIAAADISKLTFTPFANANGKSYANFSFKVLDLANTPSVAKTITLNVAAVDDTEFFVTNTNDSGAGSLRQAILDANADPGAETITFVGDVFTDATPDTITLTSGQLVIDSDTTIVGAGADKLTISGNNTSRVLTISSGRTVSLANLTIANGNAGGNYGGGIYNSGNLTASNTTIRNNAASWGGGIANESGIVTLNSSSIKDNAATNGGGGIASYADLVTDTASVIVTDSNISGNRATTDGGGINNNDKSTLTVSNSTISNNTATSGGGIINIASISATIINSSISSNTASQGGGIGNLSIATVSNSTINNNIATISNGGGIFNGYHSASSIGNLTISNSTVSGNTGVSGGGIRNTGNATLTATNVTIANNTGTTSGGGISTAIGSISNLRNTIVASNTNITSPDAQGAYVDRGNNLIGNNKGSTGFTVSTLIGTTTPINPLLGALADNGGITKTIALLSGSAAIDSGSSTNASTTDQRGLGRSSGVDIGAFEFGTPSLVVTRTGNTIAYIENDAATVIDSTFVVTNPNPAAYNNGILTVKFTANGATEDVLGIRNQGTTAGQVGVATSNITFGGTVIGSFAGGTSGTNLVVTFNNQATVAVVQAVMQNITYANTSDKPSTANRKVSFSLTDGAGGSTIPTTQTIAITTVNDDASLSSANVRITETNAALTTNGTLTITDIDSPATFVAQTNLAGDNGKFSISTTGAWTYTANSAFDSLNVGDSLSDTFDVFAFDGTKTSVTVSIDGTNDAPTIAHALTAKTILQDKAFNFIIPTNTFNDLDASDVLTYTATANQTSLPTWLTFDANTGTFSGTPAASDNNLSITVTATDKALASVSSTFALNVLHPTTSPTKSAIINGTANDDYSSTVAQVTITSMAGLVMILTNSTWRQLSLVQSLLMSSMKL
jgi:VCBS repeat-containing protein